MPYVYRAPEELTNPKFAEAFAAGCGGTIVDSNEWQGGAWCGFGSPSTWGGLMDARRDGAVWYYGDHGYFGRGEYYRITKDAFQVEVERKGSMPDTRRLAHLGLTWFPEWTANGRNVLVCPPDDAIGTLMGFEHRVWLDDTLNKLYAHTDRPVVVRHRRSETPLAEALRDAWALVTWTSNAAVEAVMAGVPVFCTGDCAASVMGRSDPINIEYPIYPDWRYEWAATLANNQWTLDEIASGMAWRALNDENL